MTDGAARKCRTRQKSARNKRAQPYKAVPIAYRPADSCLVRSVGLGVPPRPARASSGPPRAAAGAHCPLKTVHRVSTSQWAQCTRQHTCVDRRAPLAGGGAASRGRAPSDARRRPGPPHRSPSSGVSMLDSRVNSAVATSGPGRVSREWLGCQAPVQQLPARA